MYAASFILTTQGVDSKLDEALQLRTYSDGNGAVRVANQLETQIDELTNLTEVAFSTVSTDGYRQTKIDHQVRQVMEQIFEDGLAEFEESVVPEQVKDSNRVTIISETPVIPVGRTGPAARNWMVLVELLLEWVENAIEKARRVHQRTEYSNSSVIETAYWTVVARLEVLFEMIERVRDVGSYAGQMTQHAETEAYEQLTRITKALGGK